MQESCPILSPIQTHRKKEKSYFPKLDHRPTAIGQNLIHQLILRPPSSVPNANHQPSPHHSAPSPAPLAAKCHTAAATPDKPGSFRCTCTPTASCSSATTLDNAAPRPACAGIQRSGTKKNDVGSSLCCGGWHTARRRGWCQGASNWLNRAGAVGARDGVSQRTTCKRYKSNFSAPQRTRLEICKINWFTSLVAVAKMVAVFMLLRLTHSEQSVTSDSERGLIQLKSRMGYPSS